MSAIVVAFTRTSTHQAGRATDPIRPAYQEMCREFPGGWAEMAKATGTTKGCLENRVYERKGQSVDVHLALRMQAASGSCAFARAVAKESGGVFVPVPEPESVDREDIEAVYMDLSAYVGRFASDWRDATLNGEVSPRALKRLEELQQAICETSARIVLLTKSVYCKPQE